MKLFLLEQKGLFFEHPSSAVVWASSAGEARRILTEQTAAVLGPEAWTPKYAYARKVTLGDSPKVLHFDLEISG